MMGNEAPRTGGGGGPSTPPPRLRTGELSTPRTPVECPYERFALDGEGSGGLGAGGGLGGGGAAAPMDTRRTAEAIAAGKRGIGYADRNGLDFRGLPQGAWATRKQALVIEESTTGWVIKSHESRLSRDDDSEVRLLDVTWFERHCHWWDFSV